MGFALCALAFVLSFVLTRRAVGHGLGVTLATGYVYGILRANFPDGVSHFMFDAALAGLYLAYFRREFSPPILRASENALRWCWVLCLIPLLSMGLSPFTGGQHLLIQLVGLRSAVLMLPALVIGARLDEDAFRKVVHWILALTLLTIAFAVAELVLGVSRFFPENAVTAIIYKSTDVGEASDFRIPATFSSAHAFAGTMLLSLPLLLGATAERGRWKYVGYVAILAAVIGIFMSGARSPVVQLILVGICLVLLNGVRMKFILSAIPVILAVGWIVSNNPRFQRFETLSDTQYVEERVHGSVNIGFLDVLVEYPLGKGLASAVGTSIPFFLESLAEPQIGLENEISRIALEEGVLGLAAWIALLLCILFARPTEEAGLGLLVRRAMWLTTLVVWASSLIGAGLLSSIPGSFVLLLQMGALIMEEPVQRALTQRQQPPIKRMEAGASSVVPLREPGGARAS